jgi:hypothetical protein
VNEQNPSEALRWGGGRTTKLLGNPFPASQNDKLPYALVDPAVCAVGFPTPLQSTTPAFPGKQKQVSKPEETQPWIAVSRLRLSAKNQPSGDT